MSRGKVMASRMWQTNTATLCKDGRPRRSRIPLQMYCPRPSVPPTFSGVSPVIRKEDCQLRVLKQNSDV